MKSVAQQISDRYVKPSVVDLKSGDTVRVHQKIVEGGKERVQVFEGLIIKVSRRASLTQTFTVRRIASGIGVEKTYLVHSPNVLKIEIIRRSKVRRNYLSYMRARTGKSARLASIEFDRQSANAANEAVAAAEDEIAHGHSDEHDLLAAEAKEQKAEAEKETQANAPESESEKLENQPVERAQAKAPAVEDNRQK